MKIFSPPHLPVSETSLREAERNSASRRDAQGADSDYVQRSGIDG